jgi:two-component system sensor histidine kinase VanS
MSGDREPVTPGPRLAVGYLLVLVLLSAVIVAGVYLIRRNVPDSRIGPYLADTGHAIVARRHTLNLLALVIGVAIAALLAAGGVAMLRARRHPERARGLRVSARLRLALSYAVFLVVAGAAALFGVYVVLRYVPDYPLTAANPRDAAKPIASRREILEAVVGASGVILAALAVFGIIAGWILAGWVLRPLQRINEAAQIASSGRLDHRIRLTGRNDEFRQLADTFDHMLDRLYDAFATQERFAANASHELRTPLTVMETLLDVARRDPEGQDYRELVRRLSITNAHAIGLTEALLRLADANAITAVSEPLDLATIVNAAVDEQAAEAEASGIRIVTRLDPAPAIGDAALLAQLAVNLVQNAIRHNTSPGSIWIATSEQRAELAVTLRVENTGRVYTPDEAAHLSEPFLRGGGRASRARDGRRSYGLGLALVARIVAVHSGTLAITPRAGGGLIVTATLPAPNAEPARRTRSRAAPATESRVMPGERSAPA